MDSTSTSSSAKNDSGADRFSAHAAIGRLKAALRGKGDVAGIESALVHELERIDAQLVADNTATIKSMNDELRVQGHLALLEARDRLALIEPFIRHAIGHAMAAQATLSEKAASTMKLQAALARMELTDLVSERSALARQAVRRAKDAGDQAARSLGARIQSIAADVGLGHE